MTNEFAVFDNVGIRNYNDIYESIARDSEGDCSTECTNMQNCLSYEVVYEDRNFHCNMATVSWDMMMDAYPSNVMHYPGVKLYSRKCS
jgi:hypothetical protein